MSNIPVEKLREASALPRPLLEQMDSISAKIRNKAYELYLMRGSTPGSDLEERERRNSPRECAELSPFLMAVFYSAVHGTADDLQPD